MIQAALCVFKRPLETVQRRLLHLFPLKSCVLATSDDARLMDRTFIFTPSFYNSKRKITFPIFIPALMRVYVQPVTT